MRWGGASSLERMTEGMLVLLAVGAAVTVVLTTFGVATGRRDRRADVESGLQSLHNEICGARIGEKNWSMPFVRLTLYPAFCLISYAQKIVLPYTAIDAVRVERTLLGRGVRIVHHLDGAPERLIIWSSDVDALHRKLAALAGADRRTDGGGDDRGRVLPEN
jgi:hypothetical protein